MNQHFKPVAAAPILQDIADHIAGAEFIQTKIIQMLADRERQFAIETAHLRDRIDELEDLLGLKERVDLPIIKVVGCRALRKIAPIIRLFAARDLVSKLAVSLAIGGESLSDQTIIVYIFHARASLRAVGINVKNDRGRGWYLTPPDRSKLKMLLSERTHTQS